MLTINLKSEQFNSYPPESKALVTANIEVLRELPLSFVPGFLREAIDYDYRFPAEKRRLKTELETISHLSPDERMQWFQGFSSITVSPKLEHFDWVNDPAQFVEQLSEYLWATHQLDAFREAATNYADRLRRVVVPQAPAMPRLGITVIGKGVEEYEGPLFRKLRPHGAYFSHVVPGNGLSILMDEVTTRAKANPGTYQHWYIDGGDALEHDPALTCVSYGVLAPVRSALLEKMSSQIAKPGMGPEMLRSLMAAWPPKDFPMPGNDEVLDRFQLKLLTEGSGTQIFSTSFAQWAGRETLRRAEPMTLFVRFAPRQRQKPMNEMLSSESSSLDLDPLGSLADADMGAYYNFLNQQRLPGAEKASFLAWFEGHGVAVLIGPAVPRGTESASPTDMKQLLSWII